MAETALRHEARLAQELRRIVSAVEASGMALVPAYSDDLLQAIVEAAAQLFGAASVSIGLVDERRAVLDFQVAVGAGCDQIIGTTAGLGEGIVGYVATTGQPLALSNVENDPLFMQDVARRTGYTPHAVIAMPLYFDDRVLGVMEMLDKQQGGDFTMDDMELLRLFAKQAAIGIHLAQQFDLLGEVLVQRINELVNPDKLPDLPEIENAMEHPDEGDGRAGDLIEIAELFNSLSQLGPAERRACIEILSAFGEYVHGKPRFTR